MKQSDRLVLISALQHFTYCSCRFALIHIDRVWAESNCFEYKRILFSGPGGFVILAGSTACRVWWGLIWSRWL